MATKKMSRRATTGRPDRYSKKRSGMVAQSLRFNGEENKLIREAAEADGRSINAWGTRILITAAKKQIAASTSTD